MQPRTLWVKRDAGEATPAGWFLAYVIESPFCGGFFSFNHMRCRTSCLQLSTISCRHKKSGNPVKSRLPLQIKEARDGARGPGDLGLRGPERSVDIELSSPGRARKKERYRFGIVLFSSARRGSNPRPPPWQGGAPPLSHSRIMYRSKPVS